MALPVALDNHDESFVVEVLHDDRKPFVLLPGNLHILQVYKQ